MTIRGNLPHLAPELYYALKSDKKYFPHNQFKADAYSIAVTLLELAVLKKLSKRQVLVDPLVNNNGPLEKGCEDMLY